MDNPPVMYWGMIWKLQPPQVIPRTAQTVMGIFYMMRRWLLMYQASVGPRWLEVNWKLLDHSPTCLLTTERYFGIRWSLLSRGKIHGHIWSQPRNIETKVCITSSFIISNLVQVTYISYGSWRQKKLSQWTYTGEKRNWTFDKYDTLHKEQHNTLESLTEHGYTGIYHRSKVRYLSDGIKTTGLDSVKTLIISDEGLRQDFDRFITLYKDFVNQSNVKRQSLGI